MIREEKGREVSSLPRGIRMTFLLLFYSYAISNPYWVFFTDKGITPSSYESIKGDISLPITSKALLRRERALGRYFDFYDLPPYQRYLDCLVNLGAQIRTRSSWLNGVSITADSSIIQEIERLPFVKEVRPVPTYRLRELKIPQPKRLMRIEKRGEDKYRDFYGPSYPQVAMLNVPKVYFRGYTGSGVTIGLLDTGFRKEHPALLKINILKEHDFLGGDDFYLDGSPILSNISLSKDPLLFEDSILHLFYVADTFFSGDVKRWLFWVNSSNWTKPIPLSSGHSASNPTVCKVSDGLCIAWDDCPVDEKIHNINFSYLKDTTIQNLGEGRSPSISSKNDTLYLSYIFQNTSVVFQKGEKVSDSIKWEEEIIIASLPERVFSLKILPLSTEIDVFFCGLYSGKIYRATSVDGENFSSSVIVDTLAGELEVKGEGDNLYLVYKDYSLFPYTSLAYLHSEDKGKTWKEKRIISEKNLLSIGRFSFTMKGDTLLVAYETGGRIFITESKDGGRSWTTPEPKSEEFTYSPQILPSHIFWVKRGDDNTDYEEGEDYPGQFSHGTKMLSLIGGCDEGDVVGVAPGADFILAKTEKYIPTLPEPYYEFSVEEDTWIEGLEWLEASGADIVSSSLGYSHWYDYKDMNGKTSPASIAASLAAKRGLVIVNAIGNQKGPPTPYIVAPADAEGVISVGGVEIDTFWEPGNPFPDSMWWWDEKYNQGSGFGPTPDKRMKPELVAPANYVYAANPVFVDNPDSLKSIYIAGTSCATALVAGACALLLQAHPDWDAETLKKALFSTASNYKNPNDSLGYGVPNVDSAFKYTPPPPPLFSGDGLDDPFPNPFILSRYDTLYIPFHLLHRTWVELKIFSLDGKLLQEWERDFSPPGEYRDKNQNSLRATFVWDGRTKEGKEVASGIYLLVLKTGEGRDIKKVAVIR